MPVPRRTFVVSVYADGAAVLEDAHTGSRIALGTLDELGVRIGEWLTGDGDDRSSGGLEEHS